jgi:patatin-related protein
MNEPTEYPGREIRLALVCFGGVSLAVYMAGITREIQLLVEASRALGTDAERTLTGTTAAYAAALRRRAERDKAPSHVVVDVIAGSSAGGINGIFLAKGLATGADQAPLRDIWLDQGDIARLLRGWGPVPLRALNFLTRAALRRPDALAPLDGDLLLRHAFRGLRAMNPPGAQSGPRPPEAEGNVDLFVTVTDVTGRVRSISVSPQDRHVVDRTHRYVLHLRAPLPSQADDRSTAHLGQLGPGHDAALAFAARATSSFPGAFPQVRLSDVADVLSQEAPAETPTQMQTLLDELFHAYDLEHEEPQLSRFFDGGTLDNFPFEHAISAIQHKPADYEVERYLVVLQPDPGNPRPAEHTPARREDLENEPAPGWVKTLLAGFVGVRLHEPILDDLTRLSESNERIRQIDDLVRRLEGRVRQRLSSLDVSVSRDSTYADIQRATQAMHDRSESEAGMTWPHYLDLRLESITALLCQATTAALDYPPESRHASTVRALLRTLVVDSHRQKGQEPSAEFLRRYDLPLRERRLRLTVQTVNGMYADRSVSRDLLDATKAALYDALRHLWAAPTAVGRFVGTPNVLRREALAKWLDRDVTELIASHGDELNAWLTDVGNALEAQLSDFGAQTWHRLAITLKDWPQAPASTVVRAFVAFPLWDISIFPLLASSHVQQFSPVRMTRISPVDATSLCGDKAKLRGIPLHHFAAFLNRASRENDYLWGRLDAVECLLKLLDKDTQDTELADALAQVLHEESQLDVLKSQDPHSLRTFLEGRLAHLQGMPGESDPAPPSTGQ